MTWTDVPWEKAEVVETEDARCPLHDIVLLVEEQMQCPHCRAEENDGWIEHEHDRENPQGDCQECYPDIDLGDDDDDGDWCD